jgi:hypothetical protein
LRIWEEPFQQIVAIVVQQTWTRDPFDRLIVGQAALHATTLVALPHWRVVAASVRGTSHEKTGQPCQDAHCWDILAVLAVTVADGAGSATLGEVGATIAAQTAIDTLRRRAAMPAWPASDADWCLLLTETLSGSGSSCR